MAISAKLRYLRIAPRKARLVADLIRGKSVDEAQTILAFTIKKAANPILKLLKSALGDAKNNFGLESLNLYISKIMVDEGPKYKRWRPRARGQASEIQKKTSHVTLVLEAKGEKIKRIKTPKETEKKKAMGEVNKTEEINEEVKAKKAKFKTKIETTRPKVEKGIKRFFRRKAFG